MLSNGTGKARANKEGVARKRMTWRLVFLSNGEIDLASHMAESGKRTMAGQEVRMVTIPADAGQGLGIFEALHDEPDGKAMADRVKAAAFNHYGTAFIPFVRYVAENWDTVVKQSRELVNIFVKEAAPAGADGQVLRAAERFGLVAMAGDLATKAGITGWPDGAAIQAAGLCFDAWLSRRGGAGSQEETEIIRRVVDTLTKESARFESMELAHQVEQTRVNHRLGFVDNDRYLLAVPGFRDMMKGFDEKFAVDVLHANGIIRHSIGKDLPRVSLPGLGRQRCYTIEANHLPDIV